MRIDSPTGTKAWLVGKFSGSFKGHLEGEAEFARHSCQAATASFMDQDDFNESLKNALEDPSSQEIIDRLIHRGKLVVVGGVRVTTGSVEIDSGSLRIKRVKLVYDEDEDALQFKFLGSDPEPEPPIPPGPVPPVPPVPPYPPYPPFPPPPPYPPYPPFPPVPPRPPFNCNCCPLSGSCYPPESGSVKPKTCAYSIDYVRDGRY